MPIYVNIIQREIIASHSIPPSEWQHHLCSSMWRIKNILPNLIKNQQNPDNGNSVESSLALSKNK